MAVGVFISFRPEDSAWADRIRVHLRNLLSADRVWDREHPAPAGEFTGLVFAVIGETWLAGVRDPSDPARHEIESALERALPVIPILVDGTSLPAGDALPESLKGLAHLDAFDAAMEPSDFDTGPVLYGRVDEKTVGVVQWAERPRWMDYPAVRNDLPEIVQYLKLRPRPKASPARGPVNARLSVEQMAGLASARRAAQPLAGDVIFGAAQATFVEDFVAAGLSHSTKAGGRTAKKAARKKAQARGGATPRSAAKAKRPTTRAKPTPRVKVTSGSSVKPASGSFDEIVECSVFGPPTAPPGETVLFQVFLHLANQAERANFLATKMDSTAEAKGTSALDLPVRRGAKVELAFSAGGLAVDEPVQSVVWQGEPAFRQFLATVPAGSSGRSFFAVVRVSVDGKLLGAIKFRLSSDAAASQPTTEALGDHAGKYRYAFVSYASEDRKEVLKRVQALEVTKTEFFQDVLSLDPGDRWEKKLYQNIDRCDLFLLFWSQAAKNSQWVIREAEYALAHQEKDPGKEPDLVPVVLEQDVLPPPSLSSFHFNDKIGYLISRLP